LKAATPQRHIVSKIKIKKSVFYLVE